MKSSNGGASWTIQDSSFPPQSISCFTIDECTAVGGSGIVETTDGVHLELTNPAIWTEFVSERVVPKLSRPALRSDSIAGSTINRWYSERKHMDETWISPPVIVLDIHFVRSRQRRVSRLASRDGRRRLPRLSTVDLATWTSTVLDPFGIAARTPSLARTRPPALPSAQTSVRPPTSSAHPTMARPGHSRVRPRTPWISPGSPAPIPKTASPWATPATSGPAPPSWERPQAASRGRSKPRHRAQVS